MGKQWWYSGRYSAVPAVVQWPVQCSPSSGTVEPSSGTVETQLNPSSGTVGMQWRHSGGPAPGPIPRGYTRVRTTTRTHTPGTSTTAPHHPDTTTVHHEDRCHTEHGTRMSEIEKLTPMGCLRKPLSGVFRALPKHAGLTV